MSLTTTTKLEAINEILTSIGESPVNSLSTGVVDAQLAATTLDTISRRFQGRGWSFNSEHNFALTVDRNGEVHVPANTLLVDQVINEGNNYALRGLRLYDRVRHTFKIDRDVTCDLVLLLDFDDLPHPAKQYVVLKSARVFQDRAVGASDLHGYQKEDEERAWIDFLSSNAEEEDYNIFGNAYINARIQRKV